MMFGRSMTSVADTVPLNNLWTSPMMGR